MEKDSKLSENEIQLSFYIMAAKIAKKNHGQFPLSMIEDLYGEEASSRMFSYMQWTESKQWFGKSICETGTMYYLNNNWADCSLTAIRTDMERKLNQ